MGQYSASTSSALAFRVSLAIASLGALLFFFLGNPSGSYQFLLILAFFGLLLLFSYLVLRYALLKFVQRKLSLIYNTIHQLKRNPQKSIPNLSAEKAIEVVQEDVLGWYRDNKKEVDRLTNMEEYRREFIGNVSHELKTPVFNIQGYLLTLLEGGLEDPSVNRKYLERAEKSVEKLIKLLNELDMIIRLDTGGLEIQKIRFDIVALVREAIDSLELKAAKKEIKLLLDKKDPVPIWVLGDEDKISQVVTNLLINSIKYGKQKGSTRVSFQDLNDKIVVKFKDDGVGIKETELSRVFDRFYRTPMGRTKDHKGFGLGLSIVKHIVEAHQETIQLNSVENEGSEFSFTLNKSKR